MGTVSDAYMNEVLDVQLGDNHDTSLFPATIYVALFTTDPDVDGSGTELTSGGYSRQSFTNNSTNFPDAEQGTKWLAQQNIWSATEDWDAVPYWAWMDASSGGNVMYFGRIGQKDAPQPRAGGQLILPPKAMIVRLRRTYTP
jgi:hypothetical protein